MMTVFRIALLSFFVASVSGFIGSGARFARGYAFFMSTDAEQTTTLDPAISRKFKILTCSSTSCAKKRQICGMDDYATYGAFFTRIKEGNAPDVQLEEAPCLGSCKKSPCVAIQHEDYDGNVALEGMNGNEFTERV